MQQSKKSVKARWAMLAIDLLLVVFLVAIWYFMTLLGEAEKIEPSPAAAPGEVRP